MHEIVNYLLTDFRPPSTTDADVNVVAKEESNPWRERDSEGKLKLASLPSVGFCFWSSIGSWQACLAAQIRYHPPPSPPYAHSCDGPDLRPAHLATIATPLNSSHFGIAAGSGVGGCRHLCSLGNVACGSRINLSYWIIDAAMQPLVDAVAILHCIVVVNSACVKTLGHHSFA